MHCTLLSLYPPRGLKSHSVDLDLLISRLVFSTCAILTDITVDNARTCGIKTNLFFSSYYPKIKWSFQSVDLFPPRNLRSPDEGISRSVLSSGRIPQGRTVKGRSHARPPSRHGGATVDGNPNYMFSDEHSLFWTLMKKCIC